VHYDNTGNEWNEAVGPERIKPFGTGLATPGPARDYRPGEKVLVTYQNRLLLADVVMQVSAETWRVHYDGFGPEAAESPRPDHHQAPSHRPGGHAPGGDVDRGRNGPARPRQGARRPAPEKGGGALGEVRPGVQGGGGRGPHKGGARRGRAAEGRQDRRGQ